MAKYVNPALYRLELKEKIINVALQEFFKKGIKAVKMDNIATILSISKRTLYEIYSTKEELLFETLRAEEEKSEAHLTAFAATTGRTVIDIVMEFYRMKMNRLSSLNPTFIIELHKYKNIIDYLDAKQKDRNRRAIEFFNMGVSQGYFRHDINFPIISSMCNASIQGIIDDQMLTKYDLKTLFRNVILVLFRGLCTEKGIQEMDRRMEELEQENNIPKKKAALFDLDGVVFDTEPQYSRFWGGECRRYFPDQPGLENRIKGQTLVQIYDTVFAGLKEEQPFITERLNEFERQMSFDYVPGFVNFIKKLRQAGYYTAVVTSSNQEKMAQVKARRPEFEGFFDAILTSEDFEKSKPDPDCYLKAAQRFNLTPNDCVGFEDSFNGLKAVRAAGMFTVGLATTNPTNEIRDYCDVVIKDYNNTDVFSLLHI